MADEYDKKKDIEAEGQRAAIHHCLYIDKPCPYNCGMRGSCKAYGADAPDRKGGAMNLDQAKRSYENDAHFRAAVDAMTAWIEGMGVTPAEVRSAAMLACIRVEERRVRTFYSFPSDGGSETR